MGSSHNCKGTPGVRASPRRAGFPNIFRGAGFSGGVQKSKPLGGPAKTPPAARAPRAEIMEFPRILWNSVAFLEFCSILWNSQNPQNPQNPLKPPRSTPWHPVAPRGDLMDLVDLVDLVESIEFTESTKSTKSTKRGATGCYGVVAP